MAFLRQLGVNLIQLEVQDPILPDVLEDEPINKKIPKISPYGFEIEENTISTSLSEVYVQVNGDPGDKDSNYHHPYLDDSGDLVIDVVVDTHRVRTTYIKASDKVYKVPSNRIQIDKDGDTLIKMTKLVSKSAIKFSSFLVKHTKPPNAGPAWFEGKFLFKRSLGWSVCHCATWVSITMPIDEDLEDNSIYCFV